MALDGPLKLNFNNEEVVYQAIVLLEASAKLDEDADPPSNDCQWEIMNETTGEKFPVDVKEGNSCLYRLHLKSFVALKEGPNRVIVSRSGKVIESVEIQRSPGQGLKVQPIWIASSHVGLATEENFKRIQLGMEILQAVVSNCIWMKFGVHKTFLLAPRCQLLEFDLSDCPGFEARDLYWQIAPRLFKVASDVKYIAFTDLSAFEGTDTLADTLAHYSRGVGNLAIVSGRCLQKWPTSIQDVLPKLQDSSDLNMCSKTKYPHCYSESLGAAVHELLHTFNIVHSDTGMMSRGYHNFRDLCLVSPEYPDLKNVSCNIRESDLCLLYYHEYLNQNHLTTPVAKLRFDRGTLVSPEGLVFVELRTEDGDALQTWTFPAEHPKFWSLPFAYEGNSKGAAVMVLYSALWIQLGFVILCAGEDTTVSHVNPEKYSVAQDKRYLLYDVNHGEGFNLRRDVHMRVMNLVRQLREAGQNWVLVLPPWGGLYHWQSKELGYQTKITWKTFFDLDSLNRFVPVVEFEDFLSQLPANPIVDLVYYLQHYVEGWGDGWEEKWHFRPCIDAHYQMEDSLWRGWFFGYDHVRAARMECISVQGHVKTILPLILAENNTATSLMVDRAETLLHDHFGDVFYWKARRSMRYAKELRVIADEFRRENLDSTDEKDKTIIDEDWTKMKVTPGQAIGGPYLSVHWRRKDFLYAHGDEVPSVKGTADQILKLLKELQLHTVFLATDAPPKEVEELRQLLSEDVKLVQFMPTKEILLQHKDGGVSIIDQWIAAHARFFTGSYVSTFSYRIQDEREILGFDPKTSFNRLCPDTTPECEQPAKWTLVQ